MKRRNFAATDEVAQRDLAEDLMGLCRVDRECGLVERSRRLQGLGANLFVSDAGPKAMQVAAVIFDFDGVLVESAAIKSEAFAALFRRHGHEVVRQVVEHHDRNAGVPRHNKIRHYYDAFLGSPLDDSGVNALADELGRLVEDRVTAADPVAGASETLAQLTEMGIPAFVASATPEAELRRIIAARNMLGYFTGIHGSPTTKIDVARRVVKDLSVEGARVVFIGDALADLEAAQVAGCSFIGRVPYGEASIFPAGTLIVPDLCRFLDVAQGMNTSQAS